jgi:hypothetical protein
MPEGYAELRDDPSLFLVLPGHEDPDGESVVSDHGRYLVIRAQAAAEDSWAVRRSVAMRAVW